LDGPFETADNPAGGWTIELRELTKAMVKNKVSVEMGGIGSHSESSVAGVRYFRIRANFGNRRK